MQEQRRPLWLDRVSFEELRAGGYIDLSPDFRNELSCNPNPIHMLFWQRQWPGLRDDDYALLQPALQLASRLITSPRFFHFWHALSTHRRPIRTNTLAMMYGRNCYRFDVVNRELYEREKARILEKFVFLTNFHEFHFVAEASLFDADATTDMCLEPGFYPETHRSVTRISDAYLRLLRQSRSGTRPARVGIPRSTDWPTEASITRTSFHLAKNLVHELCHALNNAVTPYNKRSRLKEVKIKIEPFFMDQRRCEVGRAWESYVFGGHIDGIGDGLNMQFGISVTKWPHPFSEEGQVRAPSRRPYTTSYAIPMPWVEALWTNEFWYHVDYDSEFDFRIPKILGLRKPTAVVWTEEDEEYECLSSTDDSELGGMANDERAAKIEGRMRRRIREQLGLDGYYDGSEDSSVARNEDRHGVIRDGG